MKHAGWKALLERSLPEVTRRAGTFVLDGLATSLSERAAAGVVEAVAGVPVLMFVTDLARDLLREEAAADQLLEELSIARSAGKERSAVIQALSLGGSHAQVSEDLRAVDRHLDGTALEDRIRLRVHAVRQRWQVLAEAAAGLPLADGWVDEKVACRAAARRVMLQGRGWPVRVAAARLFGRLCEPDLPRRESARQALLDQACRTADDPWLQAAALEAYAELLGDAAAVGPLVRSVLFAPAGAGADLPSEHRFARARAAGLAGRFGCWALLRDALASDEPSEHVRCEVVRALLLSPRAADVEALRQRIVSPDLEPGRVVRATVAVASLPLPLDQPPEAPSPPAQPSWLVLVAAAIEPGGDAWVAEAVLEAVLHRCFVGVLRPHVSACDEAWTVSLQRQAAGDDGGDRARTAAAILLWLRVQQTPALAEAWDELIAWVSTASPGAARSFRRGAVASLPPDELLDVLALAADEGFDLSARVRRNGYRITVDPPPRPALWRLLYELRTRRPDKRQAHSHVVDRVPDGTLFAPSSRLAEVTPTAVPGARLASPTQLEWGADLPPPSVLLAASARGHVRVRTPAVSYTVRPKGTRLAARLRLAFRYAALARLREQLRRRPPDEARSEWDAAVDRAGFRVDRTAALPAIAPVSDLDGLARHALALDSNTLFQLALVSGGLIAWWLALKVKAARELRGWRARIPLVIGGWGSRGKSGTERLKAGLFQGLGYTVVSKTSGCEAMVLTGVPGGEPIEVYLYRPDDKASIMEQRAVMALAARTGAQVMLWECMALTPRFVEILQKGWMRDDFSTITNTYPDHEDIQGPSGRDVAETIARFIPPRGHVISSEQHMSPVLAAEARTCGAAFEVCRSEEWKLIPGDLIERFPYDEHPRNIALVTRLAVRLGIPGDVAIRAMADHVMPDLGVLKEYGPVEYEGRTLSFVNGMSANERAGFLSNWQRMGLGDIGPGSGLTEWTVVMVNNRGDRLSRQAVFASIAALDAPADATVVIGSNVASFRDAMAQHVAGPLRAQLMDLATASDAGPSRLVEEVARRLRRVGSEMHAAIAIAAAAPDVSEERVREMATRSWDGSVPLDELSARLARPQEGTAGAEAAVERWLDEVAWLHRLASEDGWSIEAVVSVVLHTVVARTVALTDPGLSGDQVLHRIASTAPAGARVRVLGSANIKGTGLGFVYRWLSIQRVLGLAVELAEGGVRQREAALRALASHPSYGVADVTVALAAIKAAIEAGTMQRSGLDAEASGLAARLERLLEENRAGLSATAEPGTRARSRSWFRMNFDVADSVARRREADQLYRDLATRRVGLARAAEVAKAITNRQKK